MTTSPKPNKDEALKLAQKALKDMIHFRTTGLGRPPEQTGMDALDAINEALAMSAADEKAGGGIVRRLNDALLKIGDFAHDHSTGPTVPDALWEIREMAYSAMEEDTRPKPQAAQPAEQREQGLAWAVRTVGGKKWLAIHASKSASDKWLDFKRKEQARSEIYEQIALKEIGVIMESQTISRGDFTGEQLRAAYHPTPPAGVPDGYALAMAVLQSDLYLKLDDQARAQCDAMLSAVPQPAAQDTPAIFKEQAS